MATRIRPAVQSAVRGHTMVTDADKAAVALAKVYAERIDAGSDLEVFGPLLLTVLEALRMTPRARGAVMGGATVGVAPKTPLDQIRERRERRLSGG